MGLKVFDLQCRDSHIFEGWFSSHEDYDSQQERGLLTCPVCQNDTITKRLSAPRLNVGHFTETHAAPESSQTTPSEHDHTSAMQHVQSVVAASPELAQIQAAVMIQMREFIRKTENVGDRFADEARKIHEGESQERPIRGIATQEERESLAQDGISVMALPDFLDTDRMQ